MDAIKFSKRTKLEPEVQMLPLLFICVTLGKCLTSLSLGHVKWN